MAGLSPYTPTAAERRSPAKSRGLRFLRLISVALIAWTMWDMRDTPGLVWQQRHASLRLLRRMTPPTLDRPGVILEAIVDTCLMASAATAVGVVFAWPLAVLGAANLNPVGPLRAAARAVAVLLRALPSLVVAAVLVRVYSAGVATGILALGLRSTGMLARVFTDSLQEVEPGPVDGARSTGAKPLQVLFSSTSPQALPVLLAAALHRLDINLRQATVLGLVGAGGLGVWLRRFHGFLDYQNLAGVAIVMCGIIATVELISGLARRELLSPTSSYHYWDRRRLTTWAVTSMGMVTLGLSLVRYELWTLVPGMLDIPSVAIRFVPRSPEAFGPSLSLVREAVYTLAVGATGAALALLFAIPASLLAARNLAPAPVVYFFTRAVLVTLRSTPILLVGLLMISAFGFGTTVEVFVVALIMFGFASKLIAETVEAVPDGPRQAVEATGAGDLQQVTSAVYPMTRSAIVAHSLHTLDNSVRAVISLGFIGAAGIGASLNLAMDLYRYEVAGARLMVLLILLLAMEWLTDRLQRGLPT